MSSKEIPTGSTSLVLQAFPPHLQVNDSRPQCDLNVHTFRAYLPSIFQFYGCFLQDALPDLSLAPGFALGPLLAGTVELAIHRSSWAQAVPYVPLHHHPPPQTPAVLE